jgi:hypothetical protein
MLAAVEMQLAGEPLAESMGRELTGFSRDTTPPNIYFDPSAQALGPWFDPVGFGTAVESYEYSKQPMNNLNFESGAGLALVYGPVINPTGASGDGAVSLLRAEDEHLASLAGLSTPDGGVPGGPTPIISWDGTLPGEPANLLGWPGFWPTLHPYEKFDPAIKPTNAVNWLCSISSDDTPGSASGVLNEDYECDYTTLRLLHRSTQITFAITPGASGWAGWKSSLWVLNYLQIMHDVNESPVDTVPAGELANVGTQGNMISGTYQGSASGAPGVYLGSSNIEGFQAGNMILQLDNQAEHWLSSLTTTDGVSLSGFPSDPSLCAQADAGIPDGGPRCDPTIVAALRYDFSAPLRWIPARITVTEDAPDEVPGADGGVFPRPTAYQIATAGSSLMGLDGLLGSFSTIYTLTDRNNTGVGGTQSVEAYFDGDPFPADDGLADGEPTLHDRALAMMRFLIVTLDRVHRDPTTGILVDDATVTAGVPTPGATVTTSSAAYTIVALRNARRSLSSLLQLYSNTTPDQEVGFTPLDGIPFTGAPGNASFSQRLTALINAESSLLLNKLTTEDGHAYDGWDVAQDSAMDTQDTLDAHTAAIRGLLAAYLATGNGAYRTRAVAVFNRMDRVFWDRSARMYDATPAPNMTVAYTPLRFAMLEAALRDLWELVGNQPGQAALGQLVQGRIGRVIKLVLNGWDDRNTDQAVQWPQECTNFDADGGFPLGGLQLAERALSGEVGSVNDDIKMYNPATRVITTDRESDCVSDIAAVGLPSALANEVDFSRASP